MLPAHLDEAYDKRFYRDVGVLADARTANHAQAALTDLRLETARTAGIGDPGEFHAYEFFHGEGPWRSGPPRLRVRTYERALEAVNAAQLPVW